MNLCVKPTTVCAANLWIGSLATVPNARGSAGDVSVYAARRLAVSRCGAAEAAGHRTSRVTRHGRTDRIGSSRAANQRVRRGEDVRAIRSADNAQQAWQSFRPKPALEAATDLSGPRVVGSSLEESASVQLLGLRRSRFFWNACGQAACEGHFTGAGTNVNPSSQTRSGASLRRGDSHSWGHASHRYVTSTDG